MPFSDEVLIEVYGKTNGYCHYCGKKLSFVNYGRKGFHGAWEIDHSKPKSRGGSDYLRNLVPACIECNRLKDDSRGTYFKRKYEPVTLGGQLANMLGLPDGFLGASRRKRLTK